MNKFAPLLIGAALTLGMSIGQAQSQSGASRSIGIRSVAPARLDSKPGAATYITKEEIQTVLPTPGTDHTIKVVDIGSEHFTVGVIHRGATGAAPASSGTQNPGAAATAACGAIEADAQNLAPGISHEKQTEGYYIISGDGVLVTGGHMVNGRTSAADSEVTTILNGPSCNGKIGGADVVKRQVKTGDIIIIPAGVPHGWSEIKDHVDYVSFRPSGDMFPAGYVNPAIKK